MKINHHITLKIDEERKSILKNIGIDANKYAWKTFSWSTNENITFDIKEDDPRWPAIQQSYKKWGGGTDVVDTRFSASELEKAQYLSVNSTWYCHSDEDYLHNCYDNSDKCKQCGIGKIQVNPFRMRMEPKWGTRHCIQFYGFYDLLFVRPEVWNDIFKPFGICYEPVYKKNTDEELKTVVQLKIDDANSPMQTEKLNYVICPSCCQKKYDSVQRGPLPCFEQTRSDNLLKTQEYFGSGALAFNLLVISQELYQAIKQYKLKSLHFIPLSENVLDNCHGRNI